MHWENFGVFRILRPDNEVIAAIRDEAQTHLFNTYSPGVYTDANLINQIIQHQYEFYKNKLNEYVDVIASDGFIAYLMDQYDKASNIEYAYKSRSLSSIDEQNWLKIGKIFRRTIKYLAEKYTILNGEGQYSDNQRFAHERLDYVWVFAEELVDMYMQSDLVYGVFPNITTLELKDSAPNNYYFILSLAEDYNIQEDIRIDTENRLRFLGPNNESPLTNVPLQDQYLGNAFLSNLGISYNDVLAILYSIIDDATPHYANYFSGILVSKQHLINSIAESFRLPLQAVESAISGFLLTKNNMESEGRELWRPQQEYRAFRRGFFEIWQPSGQYICFSKMMARECYFSLVCEIPFQKIPSEWNNDNIEITQALQHLSNKAGDWFEDVTHRNLQNLGIIGLKRQNRWIGQTPNRISIPSDVGELDYIGYSPRENILILIECKLVKSSAEPAFFRDDISAFITGRNSYLNKFNRKVQWVREHILEICSVLASCNGFPNPIDTTVLKTAIITHYPSIVQCLIHDHTCISLTNFILAYQRSNEWPV